MPPGLPGLLGWLGGANNDDSRVAGADQVTSGGSATWNRHGTDMDQHMANTCMNMYRSQVIHGDSSSRPYITYITNVNPGLITPKRLFHCGDTMVLKQFQMGY